MPDILQRILDRRRQAVERARMRVTETECRRLAARRRGYRDFTAALSPAGEVRVIAEIKRASPSKGLLARRLDPAAMARSYAAGGAAALSVLTEPEFFLGGADDLRQARAATRLPVLRKDFIFCRYQVFESAAMGADALLLIVRMLDDETLGRLIACTHDLGMSALVEIHDDDDAARLKQFSPPLVAVNSRDLVTFRTDPAACCRLACGLVADGSLVVAASGINQRSDVLSFLRSGINRFLVGEALVSAADPVATLRSLRGVGTRAG